MSMLMLFAIMFLLMFLGVEIFLSMGIAAAAYLLVTGHAPLTLIATSMINGITTPFITGNKTDETALQSAGAEPDTPAVIILTITQV